MAGIPRVVARIAFVACFGILLAWNIFLAFKLATDLRMNDFGRFYYSAQAFLQGQSIYGPRPLEVVQKAEVEGRQFGNMNPPHFHLLLLPFTFLPPKSALALWGLVSLVCLVSALRLSVREIGLELTPRSWWISVLGMLGFVGTSMVF